MTIVITKETSLRIVIELFGVATEEAIRETIDFLAHENNEVLDITNPKHDPYIEANLCAIGFLYSALRDMDFHSSDLPLFLN